MSVFDGQQRLIAIAESIKSGINLNHVDAIFLSDALYKIVEGEDPKQVLNIKPKRGERTGKAYQQKLKDGELRKTVALSWIAAATLPENEGGLGLTVEEATGRAETMFGYTYETLNTYLSKYDKLRKVIFKLPD
jgi:hypothetical protein